MTRGGKREGAGRKRLSEAGPVQKITVGLPPETVEAIKEKATAAGISQARLIALAVEAYKPNP